MKKLFSGFTLSFKKIMVFGMCFTTWKQHQIINSIIRSITVNMMNYFGRFKISPEVLFHNKTMFSNIIIIIFKGVFRFINKNISIASFTSSAFPIFMLRTFFKRSRINNMFSFIGSRFSNFKYSMTFMRTKIIISNPRRWSNNNFFANITSYYNTLFLNLMLAFRRTVNSSRVFFISNNFFANRASFHSIPPYFKYIVIIAHLICFCQVKNAESSQGWDITKPAGTSNASDLDARIIENWTALDLGLSYLRQGCKLSYSSTSALSVGAGSLIVSDSTGATRLMLAKTSAITTNWNVAENGLDAGAEAGSTTYYVYAIATAVTDTAYTIKVSTNSSAPTGVTYYKRLGSFYNDASSNITNIVNDNNPYAYYDSGWFAIAANTAYSKTHNLGTMNVLALVYSASDASGTNMQFEGGISESGAYYGISISSITATSISIFTGPSGFQWVADLRSPATSGYARIIMLVLE